MIGYKYGGGPWAARSISDLPDLTISREPYHLLKVLTPGSSLATSM